MGHRPTLRHWQGVHVNNQPGVCGAGEDRMANHCKMVQCLTECYIILLCLIGNKIMLRRSQKESIAGEFGIASLLKGHTVFDMYKYRISDLSQINLGSNQSASNCLQIR